MRHALNAIACCSIALLWASWLHGQAVDPYDPPAGYYASATGTGATLKSQLRTIISNMTGVSYGDARFSAPYTDPNPNVAGQILLIYDRASVLSTWDNAETWNREHIWPVSRLGVGDPSNNTVGIATDQINLRPAETELNAYRGNSPFGLDSASGSYGFQGAYFYPGDADAGDVARSQFYMATRYTQLSLTDGTPSGTQMGDLSSLVNYHFRDVPDAFERRRNHAIYGLPGENSPSISNPHAQHNRNPFVDHPEFVWSVFVDQANDSSLALQGAPLSASGATNLNVDLGRVLAGAAIPGPQAVTLNKAGLDGTYYRVTTTGQATSSVTGRYNAFRTGQTGSKTIDIGLNASTASPGLRSGTVTIDNLDVTTGGGAGRGANDGNDVVTVSLSVLSHANPSFSGAGDVDSLVYDFGMITQGAHDPTFSFDLFNLAGMPGFTAGLDLDAISMSGDTNAFTMDMAPFSGATALAAGGSRTFTATFDTALMGSFSTTYTLAFSDENLPGAASLGSMTLTLTGNVVAPTVDSADFNSDGVVDGADFLAWQLGVGSQSATLGQGDANGDTIVDGDDLAVWQAQFGPAGVPATSAVPEPAAVMLNVLGPFFAASTRLSRSARSTKKGVATDAANAPQRRHQRHEAALAGRSLPSCRKL
jgi:endonuclease I